MPGVKKVFIESRHACFANALEGEKLQSFFQANGWELSAKAEEADLVIYNGCAFNRIREDEGLARIQELQAAKPAGAEMIVSGCLPGINPERVRTVFQGKLIDAKSFDQFDKLFGTKASIREFTTVPDQNGRYLLEIATGCLGHCTFCGIKNAIGDTQSRPIEAIRREFQLKLAEGRQHFVLTSHDFGAYGRDIGTSAPHLLRELLKVSGNYCLELDWMDPYWMRKDLSEYVEVLQDPRIARGFFICLQSGSDRILKRMGRKYQAGHFRLCLERLLKEVEGFEPRTEVIIGFPTETEEDFLATLEALGEFVFARLLYYEFDPKPNTKAAVMDGQIPPAVKKERMERFGDFLKRNDYLWRVLQRRPLEVYAAG